MSLTNRNSSNRLFQRRFFSILIVSPLWSRQTKAMWNGDSPLVRAKTALAAYSHSNFSSDSNLTNPGYKQLESSRLSQVSRPSTFWRVEIENRVKKNISPIVKVPLAFQDLKNNNVKVIDAKCLSTLWKKY